MTPSRGCIPLTPRQVKAEWARMRSNPVAIERPVLVPSGWRAWNAMPRGIVKALHELTGSPRDQLLFLGQAFPTVSTIDEAARRLIRAAASAWPSEDPGTTIELDVVAVSMGGLVARLAALPPDVREPFGIPSDLPRLNIKRLFTLATPHRGASFARIVALDPAARDMKPGSAFLRNLDSAETTPRSYEMVCYARLRDAWVGAGNTAPTAHDPICVPTPVHSMAHLLISRDRRILLDIARRLRGEEPLARVRALPGRGTPDRLQPSEDGRAS